MQPPAVTPRRIFIKLLPAKPVAAEDHNPKPVAGLPILRTGKIADELLQPPLRVLAGRTALQPLKPVQKQPKTQAGIFPQPAHQIVENGGRQLFLKVLNIQPAVALHRPEGQLIQTLPQGLALGTITDPLCCLDEHAKPGNAGEFGPLLHRRERHRPPCVEAANSLPFPPGLLVVQVEERQGEPGNNILPHQAPTQLGTNFGKGGARFPTAFIKTRHRHTDNPLELFFRDLAGSAAQGGLADPAHPVELGEKGQPGTGGGR